MRNKACPTITCLRIWIIHIHIVTVSIRYICNFSELISSNQFSPQQMQCITREGPSRPTIPNSGTWCCYDHEYLCIAWFLKHFHLCEIHNSTLIPHCGTPYSILWIWCSTMWNVKNSTLVPHKIRSICFIMITDIPHYFHTDSTFWFHTITPLIPHSAWAPHRGKGKKLWNSTSTVFP